VGLRVVGLPVVVGFLVGLRVVGLPAVVGFWVGLRVVGLPVVAGALHESFGLFSAKYS